MTQRLLLGVGLSMLSAFACAQELPKEISGRWNWAARNLSQTFSLENIQRTDPTSFSANLTWWTLDHACTLRSVPITGRATDERLSFDARTNCDLAFTVELKRSDTGWQGTAETRSGTPIVLELKAK